VPGLGLGGEVVSQDDQDAHGTRRKVSPATYRPPRPGESRGLEPRPPGL